MYSRHVNRWVEIEHIIQNPTSETKLWSVIPLFASLITQVLMVISVDT